MNFFLFRMGKEKYDLCANELLGQDTDILKNLREYARFGIGKYWQYSQRRVYSEGSFFIKDGESTPYKLLHEDIYILQCTKLKIGCLICKYRFFL